MRRFLLILLLVQPAMAEWGWPLRVASNNRYLEDTNGTPFFVAGDNHWGLVCNPPKEDAYKYITNRAALGINMVLVRLIDDKYQQFGGFCSPGNSIYENVAPNNFYDEGPFDPPYNFGHINTNYFAHAKWIFDCCKSNNILVMACPLYLGYEDGGDNGFYDDIIVNGSTNHYYGNFIGNYFKDQGNLIWVMYGDRRPQNADDEIDDFVAGLRDYDTNHLMTAHSSVDPNNATKGDSRACAGNKSWFDFDTIYNSIALDSRVHGFWDSNPPLPILTLDMAYENEQWNATQVRQGYWRMYLNGGIAGFSMGLCPIWNTGSGTPNGDWTNWFFSDARVQATNALNVLTNHEWWLLVPDHSRSILTNGGGTENELNYKSSAFSSVSNWGIIYMPTGGVIGLKASYFATKGRDVVSCWINPSNGVRSGYATNATSGGVNFTSPNANDWVLLLEATNNPTWWFVDNAATGANDGTSWEDAFEDFSEINWSGVKAGHTFYVSGGSSSKVYTTMWDFNDYVNGVSEANRAKRLTPLTFRLGQEAQHNGTIVLSNQIRIQNYTASNIVIDMGKSPTFSTNGINPVTPWGITNNIGMKIYCANPGANYGGVYVRASDGVKLRWLEITSGDNSYDTQKGIQWDCATTQYPDGLRHRENCEVGYCYIHHCTGDAFYDGSVHPEAFGRLVIHHNIVWKNEDDGFEAVSGIDYCYNLIGLHSDTYASATGHADSIQDPGEFLRIYNNIILMTDNSCIYQFPLSEWGYTNHGCYLEYGNLCYSDLSDEQYYSGNIMGVNPRIENNIPDCPINFKWTNIIFLNNTGGNTKDSSEFIKCSFIISGPTQQYRTNDSDFELVENGFVLNNIGWKVNYEGPGSANAALVLNGGRFKIDYNSFDPGGGAFPTFAADTNYIISYRYGTNGTLPATTNITVYNSFIGATQNNLGSIKFADTTNWDFTLLASDTVARNKGIHPSNYIPATVLALMPDYDKDMLGNMRGADGYWDRGAFEYTSSSNPPIIAYNPVSQSALIGTNVNLTVTVSGTAPLSYQWYFNSNKIAWGTTASLTLTNAQTTNDGFYHVGVTNLYGVATSTVATLTMTNAPIGYITNGLLCWLRFEDDFTDGQLDDSTTNAIHAFRQGFYPTPTNWPYRTNLSAEGTYSGHFSGTNNHSVNEGTEGGRFCDYAAIPVTNLNAAIFTNHTLTSATFLAWAYYLPTNINTVHNPRLCTIMDTGSDNKGSWMFGRHYEHNNDDETMFMIFTNATTFQSTWINWPEDYSAQSNGSGGWHHYAVTVGFTNDMATIAAFFQGTNFAVSNVGGLSYLSVAEPTSGTASNTWPWIGIGCKTHTGSARLGDADQYPNYGWMHGYIDDVRLYARALDTNEIYRIFAGTESGYEPEGGSATNVIKAALRGNQTWRGNVRFQ